MKILGILSLLMLIGCQSFNQIDRKNFIDAQNSIVATQKDVLDINTSVNKISSAQTELNKQLNDVQVKTNLISQAVNEFKSYITGQIQELKSISQGLKVSGQTIAVDSTDIQNKANTIVEQTGNIKTNLEKVPDSQEKNNINNSDDIIKQQALVILQDNKKNQAANVAIAALQVRTEKAQAMAQAQKTKAQQAAKLSQELKISQAKATQNSKIIGQQVKVAQDSSVKATKDSEASAASAKKSAEDFKKSQEQKKALKEQHDNQLYTIIQWVFGVSLLIIVGGIALCKLDIQLGLLVAGAGFLIACVSAATYKWLQQMQVAGLCIVIATVAIVIGYGIYKLFIHKKALTQVVQANDASKTKLTPEQNAAIFTDSTSIHNLVQSPSTAAIVNKIQTSTAIAAAKLG